MRPPRLLALLAALVLSALTDVGALAATLTVSNLNDSGAGSLRQALLDARAAPTPATRMGLSAVPNVLTANSFAGVGAASISAEPTATSGDATGLKKAAAKCPVPSAAAAATRPASARHAARGWGPTAFTPGIRSRLRGGWVSGWCRA